MDMHINSTYPLFPILAFCSFFLALISLPLHIQVWNAGTCAYIIWVSVACLFEFINSIIWRSNTLNLAPVWCDISSKILLGVGVGIPAAGLCISRRLYVISAIKTTTKTREDKRRAVILDSCIAFGIPILVMALHYVVQGHRFDILENVGCYPSIYNTPLGYFLVFTWPSLLGCISFILTAFTFRNFNRRRLEFNQFLSTHNSLNMNRYIRLMILALSEMLSTIPISIYSVYIANKGVEIQPWASWDVTHYDFSCVGQIPAVVWTGDPDFWLSVELTCWLFPASGLVFFLLFGLASEARKKYRAGFLRFIMFFGYRPASDLSASVTKKPELNNNISVGSLPAYIPPISPRIIRKNPSVSPVPRCFDVDIEKAAGCSSPSLPSYSSQDKRSSHTASCTGGDADERGATVTSSAPITTRSTDHWNVPAYHRPFNLTTTHPVPRCAPQRRYASTV